LASKPWKCHWKEEKTISISLEEEAKELEEIVVIGYGSRAKKMSQMPSPASHPKISGS
jgi:hypothetical protein